jgi:uncharacterized protein involved in outer membrane biogenesis
MMKKIGIIIVVAVIICAALFGMRNIIAKVGIEKASEVVIGLKIGVGSLDMDIAKTTVDIKGFRLYNPKGFEDKIMVDMPEIYVDYDLPAVLKGRIHMYDMRLDLKECVVVKNKDGKLNLDSLKAVQDLAMEKKPGQVSKDAAPDFQIDLLELKIGKVVYKDYSKGGMPHVLQFNINLNEKFKNITDPDALVSLIVVKVIMNTTIGKLIKLDITGLQDTVGNTLTSATRIVGGAGKTVTGAAGGITDKLKLPFGGK